MTDISQQLTAQVLEASHSKTALRIQGGHSKPFMGRQTDALANAELLNVGEHRGIVDYQPVELVLTARAGTPLLEIEQALDEHQQMLAFEPPHFATSDTLGGTLACNLSGPARPWGGSIRDHVLGTRLINGKGEHLRFGGQVMKNVAGYDVSRLQAGAMGSLGVITEVSLKVLPKPAHTVTIKAEMDAKAAIQLMNQRSGVAKPLTAACWFQGELYMRLSGAKSAVDATLKAWAGEVVTDAEQFWQALRDQRLAFFDDVDYGQGGLPLWRFSLKPTAVFGAENQAITQDGHSINDQQLLIDWGGAQRWYKGEADMSLMHALAAKHGGQVSLFCGGDRGAEVFHAQPHALQQIQKRLKHSFDPQGIFNPGQLYNWL